MPGDFHVIDIYRDLCQGTVDADSIMLNTDQQVPQTNPTKEELLPVTVKTEPETYPYEFPETILEEINSTSFPAPSAGCTTVTEVPDQQLHGGHSPSHFIDLDLYSGTDPTLYDQVATDVKPQIMQTFYPSQEESMDEEIDDVLYYLATKDIPEECATLNISPDPTRWSIEQVGKWIAHMCKKYCIADVNLDLFQMNGKCLCLLSESDFMWRSPGGGSHLYAQLVIWKQYFIVDETSVQTTYQRCGTADTPTAIEIGRHCPSPYSMSPGSPGSSSLDSIGSSPPPSQTLEESIYTFQTKIQGRPPKSDTVSHRPTEHKQTIHLWQFLKELLMKPESYSNCIKWLDRSKGIFKIEDSSRVAKEWGRRKNRPAMNYDKLSRSIRQYYKKGIIKKTEHSKRLVYQFCASYL